MTKTKTGAGRLAETGRGQFLLIGGLLLAVLGALFFQSLLPGKTLFNNDGPLGVQVAASYQVPGAFTGIWQDLNSIGSNGGSAFLNISFLLKLLLGPLGFSKFYAPFALLFLGLSAWLCLRQFGLTPRACILGGLAATLNSIFFSTACWGVAAQPISFGLNYLALAALADTSSRLRWVRVALAGLAVGMGVMEAADIGAIFSVFVAAFGLYQAWVAQGKPAARIVTGVVRVGLVAAFAGFIAVQAVTVLVGTQIKGVSGMQQDAETRARRWDEATFGSFPKREALGFLVPGLFGFRMDASLRGLAGGEYWGAAGRDPAWDRYFEGGKQGPRPAGFLRYSGGGIYASVLVVLVALWAGVQSLRREGSVFSSSHRKFIWFWLAVMLASLLLAFGRHAPFYRLLYALPYFSTIRIPAKFLHVFSWALILVFAYGVHGLSRRYLEVGAASISPLPEHLRNWWSKVKGFDRRWTIGCLLGIGLSGLGWLFYASSRKALEAYLQTVGFGSDMAKGIAGFSVWQVGWFILFLVLAVGLVTLVLSGWCAGRRAKWGGLLLGLLLIVDLARADRPWIIYWDYPQKYATNAVIDLLREQPYEQRVAVLPAWFPLAFRLPQQLVDAEEYFGRGIYGIEWSQQLFQYYNIQSLDIVQMPRVPEDLQAYEGTLQFRGSPDTLYLVARRWQLTNTRYLLGAAGFLDVLNQAIDPAQRRFRIVARFDIAAKPGILRPDHLEELTAMVSTNGVYALFEFTGALPRAKLYSNWQISTNDQATLAELAGTGLDPSQKVLVAGGLPLAPGAGATNQNAGAVKFVSYAPKHIVLNAQAETPGMLLLNDKYDPNWLVWVDGKRETLLRCNYIMRGVYLQKGPHTVEFWFRPPTGALYVTLAALVVGLGLIALVLFVKPAGNLPPNERAGK